MNSLWNHTTTHVWLSISPHHPDMVHYFHLVTNARYLLQKSVFCCHNPSSAALICIRCELQAVNVSQTSTSSPLTCHHRFIEVCSLCLPSCTNLYFNKKLGKGLQVDDVAKITAPSLTVIGALIFLVLALLKRKDVWVYICIHMYTSVYPTSMCVHFWVCTASFYLCLPVVVQVYISVYASIPVIHTVKCLLRSYIWQFLLM